MQRAEEKKVSSQDRKGITTEQVLQDDKQVNSVSDQKNILTVSKIYQDGFQFFFKDSSFKCKNEY